ncbi:MAG: Holliday junction branch migration protein RuvA [Gammaproteobacteria bacterium]
MIGRLRGEIITKQPPHLMLDVQGVGYEIEAPMSTFYNLPEVGQTTMLHTHLLVREDAQILFGFASESERLLFRTLLKVNGVGAKMALVILSGMSLDEFSLCVQSDDVNALVRLPGIGKKTAERLIIEMRDRLDKMDTASVTGVTQPVKQDALLSQASPVADAVSALIALGYKPNDASRLVRGVDAEGLGSEQIIRAALQSVTSK